MALNISIRTSQNISVQWNSQGWTWTRTHPPNSIQPELLQHIIIIWIDIQNIENFDFSYYKESIKDTCLCVYAEYKNNSWLLANFQPISLFDQSKSFGWTNLVYVHLLCSDYTLHNIFCKWLSKFESIYTVNTLLPQIKTVFN